MKKRFILFLLVNFFLIHGPQSDSYAGAKDSPEPTVVPLITINEPITISVSEQITRALIDARFRRNPAVMIELNTPGGFTESTRDLVQLFLSSDIPIIVWIAPENAQAASAGVMVAEAAHFLAMAESTTVGGSGIRAEAKVDVVNKGASKERKQALEIDTLSFVDAIADKRSRNLDWVRTSVTEASLLGAKDALRMKVVDAVASSRPQLWAAAREKLKKLPEKVEFRPFPKNQKEKLTAIISKPDVSFGLMAFGALGIYAELTYPGLILPGAIGGIAIAAGALSMWLIPIRHSSIYLLVAGILLIAIEILTPLLSFGVVGFLGAILAFFSGLFLVDKSQSDLILDANIWIPIFVAVFGIMTFFTYQAIKTMRAKPVSQGADALISKVGEVRAVIGETEATVDTGGESWSARWHYSVTAPLAFKKGQKVKIVAQKGFTIFVVPEA